MQVQPSVLPSTLQTSKARDSLELIPNKQDIEPFSTTKALDSLKSRVSSLFYSLSPASISPSVENTYECRDSYWGSFKTNCYNFSRGGFEFFKRVNLPSAFISLISSLSGVENPVDHCSIYESIYKQIKDTAIMYYSGALEYNVAKNFPVANFFGFLNSFKQEKIDQFTEKISFPAKVIAGVGPCLLSPIIEEVAFRGLVQKWALKKVWNFSVQRIYPNRPDLLRNSTAEKVFRIGVSNLMFGMIHLHNLNMGVDPAFVLLQTLLATGLGIFLGAIAESKLGITGAIGAHALNNSIATLYAVGYHGCLSN